VHYDDAKLENCIIEFFCSMGNQSLLSLPGIAEKNFSFHSKRYNLTICAVNFFETFCTCFPSRLGQDPAVKIPKKDLFIFSFFLLELEMADLRFFFEKNDLHPLGFTQKKFNFFLRVSS
jgi:hypothetical protein